MVKNLFLTKLCYIYQVLLCTFVVLLPISGCSESWKKPGMTVVSLSSHWKISYITKSQTKKQYVFYQKIIWPKKLAHGHAHIICEISISGAVKPEEAKHYWLFPRSEKRQVSADNLFLPSFPAQNCTVQQLLCSFVCWDVFSVVKCYGVMGDWWWLWHIPQKKERNLTWFSRHWHIF